jgi:hypothetical protein
MVLSRQDQRRMAELHRLFEEQGWRLRVDLEEDGSAIAWFHPRHGASAHEIRGRTPLEAALGAWADFKTTPNLRGSSDAACVGARARRSLLLSPWNRQCSGPSEELKTEPLASTPVRESVRSLRRVARALLRDS